MSALTAVSEKEREVADEMRELAVSEIEQRGIEKAAEALGIAPTGVRALLWKNSWSIEMAFRVIEALDMPIVEEWHGAVKRVKQGDGD